MGQPLRPEDALQLGTWSPLQTPVFPRGLGGHARIQPHLALGIGAALQALLLTAANTFNSVGIAETQARRTA